MNIARRQFAYTLLGLTCMASASIAGAVLKPTKRLSETLPRLDLETAIPKEFATWKTDDTAHSSVINPQALGLVNRLYSQVLTRTYIETKTNAFIMLSIAYGANQSDAVQLHTPEACYPAQGFSINNVADSTVALPNKDLAVRVMLATQNIRHEPITYWATIGTKVKTKSLDRKLAQIEYGFENFIPDGLIFRVSNIDLDKNKSWELHQKFIQELVAAISPDIRARFVGE